MAVEIDHVFDLLTASQLGYELLNLSRLRGHFLHASKNTFRLCWLHCLFKSNPAMLVLDMP